MKRQPDRGIGREKSKKEEISAEKGLNRLKTAKAATIKWKRRKNPQKQP